MRTVRRQRGVAALMTAMFVLFAATLVTFFSARVITTDLRIFKNVYDKTVAEDAAQAGFDYALGYLNEHLYPIRSTHLSNCASVSNSYTLASPGALTNGSTYTMQFGCITANSTTYLRITATGTSVDSSATRTVTAVVGPAVLGIDLWAPTINTGLAAVLAVGTNDSGAAAEITMKNQSFFENSCSISTGCLSSAVTAGASAGTASFKNQSYAQASSTTVTSAISPTVQENQASLASMSATEMQNNYLGHLICGTGSPCVCGAGSTCVSSFADTSLTPSVSTSYTSSSSLSGITGQIIFIDVGSGNEAEFDNGFRLGTSSVSTCNGDPVTLLVNGNVHVKGTGSGVNICGSIFATGSVLLTNSSTANGLVLGLQGVAINTAAGAGIVGVAVGGPNNSPTDAAPNGFSAKSKGSVIFDSKILLNSRRYLQYAVVPGSWRDF